MVDFDGEERDGACEIRSQSDAPKSMTSYFNGYFEFELNEDMAGQ